MLINISTDAQGRATIHELKSLDGKPVLVEQIPAHSILLPVKGRGGITYQPPTQHLGKPLTNNLPLTVGRVAIVYLEALLVDAEARAA